MTKERRKKKLYSDKAFKLIEIPENALKNTDQLYVCDLIINIHIFK